MFVQKEIIKNRDAFVSLCREHKVKCMYAFGSGVTGNFDLLKSDVDLLVEIDLPDPVERGEILISLWDELERFFKRKVDLLTNSSIKNPYLKESIDSTKILIYDGKEAEILV